MNKADKPWEADYSNITTVEDIYYCFRLILGRNPSEQEWFSHLDTYVNTSHDKSVKNYFLSQEFADRRWLDDDRFPEDSWVLATTERKFKIYVDLHDRYVSRSCLAGDYEPAETNFLLRTIKPGNTFLDIGANIGWFTLNAANIIGAKGKVFAFEPRKDTYDALSGSINENNWNEFVNVFNCAVGRDDDVLEIAWSGGTDNPGGTCLITNDVISYELSNHQKQVTSVKRLDNIIGEESVDMIKIDIEGAEFLALEGCINILKKNYPIILSEISPDLLQKVSGVSASEYIKFLTDLGYKCYKLKINGIGEQLKTSTNELDTVHNVVFIRE